MTVEVYVRRADRQVEGQVSGWEKVTWHGKRDDVGRWTVTTKSPDDATAMSPVVNSAGDITAPKGVIIRNGGVTVASGWCEALPEIVHSGGVTTWTFSGWDDTVHMADTLCWPSPGNAINFQAAHRVITSARSSMIRALWTENVMQRLAIPGTAAGTADTIGAVRTRRIRFANLLEISQAIAGRTVNFRVVQSDLDNTIVLRTWAPVDKRLDVQFSPQLGTVAGWSSRMQPAEASRVIIAAGGELAARGLRQYVNTAEENQWAGVRKVERFKDRRDLDITNPDPGDDWVAEAAEDATDFLEENRSRAGFEIDATGLGYSYGPDYVVGDMVRAYVDQDVDGQPVGLVDDLIEEAAVTWSSEGERAQLRIGPTAWTPAQVRERRARELGRRVAALETRL